MKRITHFANALPRLQILFAVVLTFSAPASAAERALSFAVPGVIADIKAKVGAPVQKGAILAVLDLQPIMASRKASRVRVEAAVIKNELMARRLVQTEQLFDSLSASVEDVEDAKTAAAIAISALEDARAHAAIVEWTYQRSTLRAPFGGTVAAIPGYPGMVIPENIIVPVVVVRVP